MNTDFVYTFPPLIPGILKRRYKRFLADIELESGEMITAHCANTGPMIGVCDAESQVYVSKSNNPKRKLAYSWELIEVDNTWVGINTALPNRVIKQILEQEKLPHLKGKYNKVRSEVPYGKDKKSRIDFVLTNESQQNPIYLEVKNTTLAKDKIALFPDTVTTRGQKHLQELMDLLPDAQPIMLYFINRGDCQQFSPGDDYDPGYGKLFREAVKKGVEILPCRFEITPQGIRYLGLADLKF
ncbi:sugar fermentation stimulation protein [Crocosphaera subtropica ATCC 51142]|uniref:Sugar fermentation stimulation protein homolog n=1 Tax=Crocosphaera subtropica (strain ATCC 51142 / BH68) TaxID=43989 RepID=SFSA_CROS5|nr:DNA/RNA nuclease SfsA [Crocosphaera subtropica]B1WT42.1 RecName: Full=Sugar fermentation stimulation protein homolog [Crocosphaera subtropica ATCC 51142]ACB51964.1 sugar fermentation stimulation protein [Crocosphaera subtropica ATCC 51142]